MYTLDTNAIIYCLKNDTAVIEALETVFRQDVSVYVSTITELELFSHSALSTDDVAAIESFLAATTIIDVNSQLARIAGRLRQEYRQLRTADSAIAATALLTHSILVTRNVRDFQRIDTLQLMAI